MVQKVIQYHLPHVNDHQTKSFCASQQESNGKIFIHQYTNSLVHENKALWGSYTDCTVHFKFLLQVSHRSHNGLTYQVQYPPLDAKM